MSLPTWSASWPAVCLAAGGMLLMEAVLTPRPTLLELRLTALLRPGSARPTSWLLTVARRSGAMLERVLDGAWRIERWQMQAGRHPDHASFRLEQVIWAWTAVVLSGAVVSWQVVLGRLSPPVGLVAVLGCGSTGVLAREHLLRAAARYRLRRVLAELPLAVDLVALAVTAGRSPSETLDIVVDRCRGPLAVEVRHALRSVGPDASLAAGLFEMAERLRLPAVTRFVEDCLAMFDRGRASAEVLPGRVAGCADRVR